MAGKFAYNCLRLPAASNSVLFEYIILLTLNWIWRRSSWLSSVFFMLVLTFQAFFLEWSPILFIHQYSGHTFNMAIPRKRSVFQLLCHGDVYSHIFSYILIATVISHLLLQGSTFRRVCCFVSIILWTNDSISKLLSFILYLFLSVIRSESYIT